MTPSEQVAYNDGYEDAKLAIAQRYQETYERGYEDGRSAGSRTQYYVGRDDGYRAGCSFGHVSGYAKALAEAADCKSMDANDGFYT